MNDRAAFESALQAAFKAGYENGFSDRDHSGDRDVAENWNYWMSSDEGKVVMAQKASIHAEALAPTASNADSNDEVYVAGLAYLVDGNLQADGYEDETNAPYYFGHTAIKAFEAGAVWQAKRGGK